MSIDFCCVCVCVLCRVASTDRLPSSFRLTDSTRRGILAAAAEDEDGKLLRRLLLGQQVCMSLVVLNCFARVCMPPFSYHAYQCRSYIFFLVHGLNHGGGASANARTTATKPLTMFYNGGVAVFHLPQDKAEDLMKMAAAEGGGDGRPGPLRPNHGEELLSKMRQEMPIASKRSLQRFFQKRKERMFRP
ncbi:hypothetical protein PVAP13_5KG745100 [Panicum virgatum]|uniref:Protein TIFY n=1 Tax=Panicum virgatum TaxID=38727 RepID=A0A8T0T3Z3_PANVG|nr:hypothetical protein PVAP13_5KG745100 [Panicum virgatum]